MSSYLSRSYRSRKERFKKNKKLRTLVNLWMLYILIFSFSHIASGTYSAFSDHETISHTIAVAEDFCSDNGWAEKNPEVCEADLEEEDEICQEDDCDDQNSTDLSTIENEDDISIADENIKVDEKSNGNDKNEIEGVEDNGNNEVDINKVKEEEKSNKESNEIDVEDKEKTVPKMIRFQMIKVMFKYQRKLTKLKN